MKCTECGGRLRATRVKHRLTDSGLPHVTVAGVEIRRCGDCGEYELAFPRFGPLHRAIAVAFARKETPLAGEEIRFLRGYLGWSGRDFAASMGVARATVSRWERGRLHMGASAERLLRLVAALEEPDGVSPADILRFPFRTGRGPLRLHLSLRRGAWHAVAA